MSTLGTSAGQGCGKVPHANCQECIDAQTYKDVPSCGLNVHADKSGRKFSGEKRKHCSRCPFPEGCMMCTMA